LAISLGVAILAGLLVFGIWYPYPYREISGGRELFLILVAVDVILGPLITLAIFNRSKPFKELRRDLVIVVMLQLAALGYGMWTVFVARPVHMVFEVHRFRVVHALDVPTHLLSKAPAGLDTMPVFGPTLLSTRPFKDSQEQADATLADLGGMTLGARPDFWQPYEAAKAQVLESAKPISELKRQFPEQAVEIDKAVATTGKAADALLYATLVGRKSFWTVLVDKESARVLAFIPLDST